VYFLLLVFPTQYLCFILISRRYSARVRQRVVKGLPSSVVDFCVVQIFFCFWNELEACFAQGAKGIGVGFGRNFPKKT